MKMKKIETSLSNLDDDDYVDTIIGLVPLFFSLAITSTASTAISIITKGLNTTTN